MYSSLEIAQPPITMPINGSKLTVAATETYSLVNTLSDEQIAYKRKIERLFKDEPIMAQIAYCESGYRQFDENGAPLKSRTNDYGIFQINSKIWDKKAKEIGLDYKGSPIDNIKMARYIYEHQGKKAWVCYGKVLTLNSKSDIM